jgi:riboflavin synthase
MFTGIIETTGQITDITKSGTNFDIIIESTISKELKIDQSVSHNGVCLTVVEQNDSSYKVTAVEETIKKTNLGKFQIDDMINLERCMKADGRFDGHIVQGHVDQVATCIKKEILEGSWLFEFQYDDQLGNITVEKGSITINGVSLTCFSSKINSFQVTIIPYTMEHTNFKTLEIGASVNLEFDIIGKYVSKLLNK